MSKKNKDSHLGTLSIWSDTVEIPRYFALREDRSFDVCVVGGGIGGITTAYLLAREGKNVCVLESARVGGGQTGQTTAHFTYALDDRFFELEKLHGLGKTRLAGSSHSAAIETVAEIVARENIDCDFARVPGFLFARSTEDAGEIDEELAALNRAGLGSVEKISRIPNLPFDSGVALAFPDQVQLHPLKYLQALSEKIIEMGGSIFVNTHVKEIKGGGDAHVVSSEGHTVHADAIVVATNAPVNNWVAIHTKQAAYRTYVIGAKIPKGSVANALYWDTGDPYHYVRVQPTSETDDTLIVGGEDHKTGQMLHPEECFARLKEWTESHFPMIEEIIYEWSGQVVEPVDGLAYLGHNPMDRDNVYVITGDSGNGMTHCTVGALLITDQILGRPNDWETVYDPSRINLKAAGTFTKENVNTAVQYRDWFRSPDPHTYSEIPCDHGAVVSHGLHKVAVYRHADGSVETCSAICTHLGGIVRWNDVEKSWDCPCHGSRFDHSGKVIEGPALTNLATIQPHPQVSHSAPPQLGRAEKSRL